MKFIYNSSVEPSAKYKVIVHLKKKDSGTKFTFVSYTFNSYEQAKAYGEERERHYSGKANIKYYFEVIEKPIPTWKTIYCS